MRWTREDSLQFTQFSQHNWTTPLLTSQPLSTSSLPRFEAPSAYLFSLVSELLLALCSHIARWPRARETANPRIRVSNCLLPCPCHLQGPPGLCIGSFLGKPVMEGHRAWRCRCALTPCHRMRLRTAAFLQDGRCDAAPSLHPLATLGPRKTSVGSCRLPEMRSDVALLTTPSFRFGSVVLRQSALVGQPLHPIAW